MALQKPSKTKKGPPKGVSNNPAGPKPGYKLKKSPAAKLRAEIKAQESLAAAKQARDEELAEAPQKNKGGRPLGSKKPEVTPLSFMLDTMKDPKMPHSMKFEAAKQAAPYVHKKMPIAIEGTDKPIRVMDLAALAKLTDEELDAMDKILARIVKDDEEAPDSDG